LTINVQHLKEEVRKKEKVAREQLTEMDFLREMNRKLEEQV